MISNFAQGNEGVREKKRKSGNLSMKEHIHAIQEVRQRIHSDCKHF
jgi:hypothetical protein